MDSIPPFMQDFFKEKNSSSMCPYDLDYLNNRTEATNLLLKHYNAKKLVVLKHADKSDYIKNTFEEQKEYYLILNGNDIAITGLIRYLRIKEFKLLY